MAVTQDTAQDAIPSIGFWTRNEHFLRREQTLVDEDADHPLPKSFLFIFVALSVFNVKFRAFDKKVVQI